MELLWQAFDWAFVSRILDITLVFFLIYRLLLLVRGTRAEPMLLGLGIVVLVYLASRILHLATLHWILGNFLGSVILVIVVLFQEDLRRALIKVGLVPGFAGEAPRALEATIKEVAHAAATLSSRRIGGLIVMRREVGLEDYAEPAVQVDAKVSHQLLISIFLPASPLHDGAIIIDRDRIVAAGAVLPLSFSRTLGASFGTRHRAAIGLSERSDALVVVISEETGGISLIREGRISKDLDEKSLYTLLQRLMANRGRGTRGKKKAVPENGDSEAVKNPKGIPQES